ncbi:hypothetical protein [Rhodococcus tibetensis]|uniref:Uncharacterized protein n=1 Tax=Rhodococcus tibetensis TaxID=2965064 RepID=A0ABT1Q724_9NOCA|nr:hypothetical protein [Rhodococcus sp. FXJ9.536]MCQ4118053.1 hypothetical protein [Rhodococcus sp. FXJ9.536]
MIDDLIEIAYAQGTVRTAARASNGVDEYELARIDCERTTVTVAVRADGKFAKATTPDGYLSLGQVMQVCGLHYRNATSRAREIVS